MEHHDAVTKWINWGYMYQHEVNNLKNVIALKQNKVDVELYQWRTSFQ